MDKMKTAIPDLKSSNWIAKETGFKAANGKTSLSNWKLKDHIMCHCLFRSLMTSAFEQQQKNDFKTISIIFVGKQFSENLMIDKRINPNYFDIFRFTIRIPGTSSIVQSSFKVRPILGNSL